MLPAPQLCLSHLSLVAYPSDWISTSQHSQGWTASDFGLPSSPAHLAACMHICTHVLCHARWPENARHRCHDSSRASIHACMHEGLRNRKLLACMHACLRMRRRIAWATNPVVWASMHAHEQQAACMYACLRTHRRTHRCQGPSRASIHACMHEGAHEQTCMHA